MTTENKTLKLWYEQPAVAWEEALPLGNGRIGAMVFGQPEEEEILLNEDTLWSGYPRPIEADASDEIPRYCQEAGELTRQRRYREAHAIIQERALGNDTASYLPLGGIKISQKLDGSLSNYYRDLNLENAVASVSFDCSGITYSREAFISAPDQLMAILFTANRPGKLDLKVSLTCPLRHVSSHEGNLLLIDGIAPQFYNEEDRANNRIPYSDNNDENGMRFRTALEIVLHGGSLSFENDQALIHAADQVELRMTVRTSYNGFDKNPATEGKECVNAPLLDLAAVRSTPYDQLKKTHIDDYSSFFRRVTLSINKDTLYTLPTDQRLTRFQTEPTDSGLYVLLFQYARYLSLACSRPGTLASNLQGIWNHHLIPPWRCNYTTNINTEMNYWPMERCNLPEMTEPLFSMIERQRITGRKAAQVWYGADGVVSHHNVDPWGKATPASGHPVWGFWPMSYGWMCQHLFDHYLYSGDLDFLRKKAFPAIQDAADFFLSMLTLDDRGPTATGKWMLCPSTSPENMFLIDGEETAVAKTTTMTTAIIREVLRNYLKSAELLNIPLENAADIQDKLANLYPYQIGSKGQLLEWNEEFIENQVEHRHVSHLYGLFPGTDIRPDTTPELADACRRSLELRGDNGTGWSLAWKINLWARLRDGNHALKMLKMQLNYVTADGTQSGPGGGTYPNLFDAHPPFQIDGNFGTGSGITMMLLQSDPDLLQLLPALPDEWQEGDVTGLRAQGGIQVDLSWREGRLTRAVFHPDKDVSTTLAYGGHICPLSLKAGEPKVLTF